MQRDSQRESTPVQPSAPGAGAGRLRVAVVTESFLPTGSDVTAGVCRILEHLSRRGHDAVVICPGPAPESFAGARVITVPSLPYRRSPIGMPSSKVIRTLSSFAPDVVHLASPFVLGAAGMTAAAQLGVPAVAVFHTDVPGYTRRHRAGLLRGAAWRWVRRIHEQADLTLAPSPVALAQLRAHAVPRLALWQRGVDGDRFTPARRTGPAVAALRSRLAPNGEVLVGLIDTIGTHSKASQTALAAMAGVRLVLIGEGGGGLEHGPSATAAAAAAADPVRLGGLEGDDLADAYAALDVFVHAGVGEAADRTLQEAMASGVPVVAPARGGPLDLVAPGLNGMLYGPGDDVGLRAAVAALTADAEQRRWMGTAARLGVERRGWEQLGDQLIEHYRSVLARRYVAA